MLHSFLLFFCIYIPFQFALNPTTGIDLASGRVFVLLLAISWIFHGLKSKKLIIRPTIQTFLIISFLFLSAFSLIYSHNISWSIRKLLFLLSIFPLYFVVSAILRNNRESIKVLKFLVWGAGISALLAIIQFSLQFVFGIDRALEVWSNVIVPFLGESFSKAVFENPSWLVNISGATIFRAVSLFPDPHMLSFYMGLLLPWAFAFYFFYAKKGKYLLLFFTILTAALLTFSRGGYLGILAGFIFGVIFFWKEIGGKYKNISAVILIFTVLFFIIPNPISQRLVSSFDLNEGSNLGRIETWKKSINVFQNNPLFGVGLGNYPLEIKPSANYREPIYSHNIYLDIASETGIINLFAWTTLILASIFSYIKKAKKNPFFFAGSVSLVIFSVHSLFETPLFSPRVLPLLLIIIAISTIKND